MKAIILAAGIGSRLKPITNKKPKAMVKINGIPIIKHQIESYLRVGLSQSDIIIVVGYKANIIKKYLKKNFSEVKIILNKNYNSTNNMFSLYLALSLIQSESIIISNGDCVYEKSIIKDFIRYGHKNSIACDKGSYNIESMKIVVKQNKVTHISKKISISDAFGNSIDLYKLDPNSVIKLYKIIESIIEEDKNLWSEVALDKLFKYVDFAPFDINKRKWVEIDDYNDLSEADKKFSNFRLNKKKCFILDLDGTIYLGNQPINGTINFIKNNANKYSFYYMSNNTSITLNDYVEKLKSFEIKTNIDHIITPLVSLIEYMKKYKIKNVYILGNKLIKKYLKNNLPTINITRSRRTCEAVIITYDTELTYKKLKTASLLLQNKEIKLLATHEDIVCPTEFGAIPDIGTILKTIELTTKRKPNKVFGKPNSVLLDPILKKYKRDEIVIVGDRLYTDKILADNSGIDFILVLSGETKREDLENIENFPLLILKDLGEIK